VRKTTCPNTEIHGTGWNRPNLVRLYIRESQKATEYGTPAKRAWLPVGVICADEKCRRVILDDLASSPEDAA
jgi:hypothetical protein